MEDLPTYIKKELVKYINKEMGKGYSLDDISAVLRARGHHQDLVRDAISSLIKHKLDVSKALTEPLEDDLKWRLMKHILNALVGYISHYKTEGYTIPKIKKALLDFGHTEETIDAAIREVGDKHVRAEERFRMIVVSLSLISVVLFLMVVTILTKTPTPRILAAFLPMLASLLLAVTILKHQSRKLLWVVPGLLCIAFYVIGLTGKVTVLKFMDLGVLTFINLVIAYVYLLLLTQPVPEEWIGE
ncbi:MAG: hypothetical protein KJ709_02200 [Nanoarchaeota archaeon]|nr:hypothetical protein [Nanoarchaeota archaeon]